MPFLPFLIKYVILFLQYGPSVVESVRLIRSTIDWFRTNPAVAGIVECASYEHRLEVALAEYKAAPKRERSLEQLRAICADLADKRAQCELRVVK